MNFVLVLEQTLNGLQLGVMLFLMAAGLTLVFGIMNLVNLAHGSLYMVGAYLATYFYQATGSYPLGVLLGLAGTLVVGIVVELVALRTLYERDHLDQVLATFGLILFFNELMAILWGRAAIYTTLPDYLSGHVELFAGLRYPLYRLVIIAVGLAVAGLLWFVVARTRLGMLIRAGASNRAMVAALGVNVRLLYTFVFGFGAALAGLAGLMSGPIHVVQPGMGELILIEVFVVIVIGGIGSIRGALAGALIVGMADTLGRAFVRPLVAALANQPFYLDLVRRVMIFAIAALSLNLILGYGGMISFGHAAYLGVGAYAVGVLAHYGINNGYLQWALAIGASALVALAIGAVSIRTSGVYFIMITLAFTQMLYYLGISIAEYGGDDGMRLAVKSQFPGLVDLNDANAFYYLVLGILVLALFLGHRLVNSRFVMVIRAARSNELRTRSIGFSPYPYRLAAFVIAGAVCGLAGALLVNHTAYLTPEFMNWTRSGELMFMVILGGMGSIAGPVLGAFALLLLEDALSGWTQHWQLILGPLLVLSVLFLRRGLAGLFFGKNE